MMNRQGWCKRSIFSCGGHLRLEETVGSAIREDGGDLVSRLPWDRYRLGHQPVNLKISWLNVQSGRCKQLRSAVSSVHCDQAN